MKRCLVLLLVSIIMLVGCGYNYEKQVSESNDFKIDTEWGCNLVGFYQGRVYTDKAYYRTENGVNYIAYNNCSYKPVLMRYDEIMSLQPGTSIVIDRDFSVQVDCLDYEEDWDVDDVETFGRLRRIDPGRIRLNDDFYFTHLIYDVNQDGSIQLDDYSADSIPDDFRDIWILRNNSSSLRSMLGDMGQVYIADDIRWIPLSSNCSIEVYDEHSGVEIIDQEQLLNKMTELKELHNIVFCIANVYFNDAHEIHKMEIIIDQKW